MSFCYYQHTLVQEVSKENISCYLLFTVKKSELDFIIFPAACSPAVISVLPPPAQRAAPFPLLLYTF